jgi:anhydro-N-acetylmuramic acid kinase
MLYRVIGFMSGTSLDGMDLVHCHIEFDAGKWKYHIHAARTYSYTDAWKTQLANAHLLDAAGIIALDRNYGNYIGEVVLQFINEFELSVDLISSHGHTVLHQPEKGITYQIGYGANIYATTQIPVVCDFRTLDVALGGQGAPLVPIGDELLFGQYDACLNLGGFSNISYVHKGQRIAYDISPCNIVLNKLAGKLGKSYDESGNEASKGQVDKPLLQKLNALSYYNQPHPKSLGREWVAEYIEPLMEQTAISINDALATFTHHIAEQIVKCLQGKNNVLVTGGGAFNSYLITLIRAQTKCEIMLPDPLLINYKEALIFAFLGLLKLRNEKNTLCSVTGASRDSSGGELFNG